ncbi:MAG: tetratricopeptide repeat protein [Candidatus Brocadia sp.]|nr:tetratricopeptide repeat protein [Candidatus Brocadia sp.]MDG6026672.1 tetratricopeptide repeat protein [Candidatus Brocadia sp.]
MMIRLRVLFLFLLPFLDCGISSAHSGSLKSEIQNPKSGISRDEAVKLCAEANEKYLQAMKLIASKSIPEADQKLKEATDLYEIALTGGFRNGQIYYNLGNTYYRRGELGKAIVNYRRAERLMPRNADINANLRLAKGSTKDKELSTEIPAVIKRIFFWLFFLNRNELSLVAISLYVVLMAILFFSTIRRYAGMKKLSIGFSSILFVVIVSFGIKIYLEQGINYGVIVTSECEVRYGPGEEYEPKFEIHNGAECVIEDEKDDWYRVYVKVGVKRGAGSETGVGEKASREVRRGWLQKKYVDLI